jgi:LysM repeat protein
MSGSLEKAHIKILNGKNANTKIDCAFNPQEYQISKQVEYSNHSTLLNVPVKQFTNGRADQLSMELFFDTTKTESDVRTEYLDKLDSLLEVDGQLHAPPRCRFVWGGGLDFKALLVDANKRFTRFLSSGTPVRAWVDVTFEQYKPIDEQKSEIKHESTDKMKIWTVTEGDTLWLIAQKEYGDPSHWRTIAEANDLENPRSLDAGTKLSLPPL